MDSKFFLSPFQGSNLWFLSVSVSFFPEIKRC